MRFYGIELSNGKLIGTNGSNVAPESMFIWLSENETEANLLAEKKKAKGLKIKGIATFEVEEETGKIISRI